MKKKKLIASALLAVCVIGQLDHATIAFASTSVEVKQSTSIEIPDRTFRNGILSELGKSEGDEITVEELQTITELDIRGVSSIEGIQYCTSLEGLHVYDSEISDLSYLSGLTALLDFRIESDKVDSLEPLASLRNISCLDLQLPNVSDIEVLSNFSGLQVMWLHTGKTTDLSPLSGLSGLKHLFIGGTKVSDLTPISSLTQLKMFSISRSEVEDLSPLSTLTNLTYLGLSENQISDLTPISDLTNLITLYLNGNEISSIEPLRGLTNLEGLNLAHNNLTDITPLEGLVHLSKLYLNNNTISDISAISNLTDLTAELWLQYNTISDITPLASLTSLEGLCLNKNDVSDISSLSNLVNMKSLQMSNNQVVEIDALSNLTNLTTIDMQANKIKDVSPLATLTKLTSLSLQYNAITDLRPIASLNNLTSLRIQEQFIYLDEETITEDYCEVENEIYGTDDIVKTILPDIYGPGTYDEETNTVRFEVTKDKEVIYLFRENVTIGSATALYSGNVMKQVNYAGTTNLTVSLDKKTVTLSIAETDQIKATIDQTGHWSGDIIWTSSASDIVEVDSEGKIQALKTGTATITATAGNKSASCVVTVVQPVSEILLDQTEATVEVGDSITLTPSIYPANATDQVLSWESSNRRIAVVEESGKVRAVAPGTASITVTVGEKSATCIITVVQPVNRLSLNKSNVSMEVGKSTTLKATISPSNATNKSIVWTSSDPAIVEVDEEGMLTAKAAGTATITASSVDGQKEDSCQVTVTNPVTEVELNKKTASLFVGYSMELEATLKPLNATEKTITWTSSNPKVAVVSPVGVVSAKSTGTAIITAKVDNISATCVITVKKPSLKLSSNKITLYTVTGTTAKLTAQVVGADPTVLYQSSNAKIVKVDQKGTLTAVAAGTARITVTANDVTSYCDVTVKKTSIRLNKQKVTLYTKGTNTSQLSSTVVGKTSTVTYKSKNTKVAKVDKNGKVTAVAAGTVKITATANGVTTECTVTVKKPTLTVNKTSVTLKAKKSIALKVTATPASTITFTSSNKKVATVTNKGVIKGIKTGKATITIKANGITKRVSVKVK